MKVFVDAAIKVSGDGTNEVGANHTFMVTVTKDVGDGTRPHAAVTSTSCWAARSVRRRWSNNALSSCDDAGNNLSAATPPHLFGGGS